MNKLVKSFHRGQKGFTLIELLIVIVILGVLAAAIIPNLSKFVGSGKVGAANAELASVRTAVSAFQADNNGTVPATPLVPASTWYQQYMGAGKAVKGTYAIDQTVGLTYGNVTGTTHPDATWDIPNDKWK
jgi:type IV pilus assembly protein PilA